MYWTILILLFSVFTILSYNNAYALTSSVESSGESKLVSANDLKIELPLGWEQRETQFGDSLIFVSTIGQPGSLRINIDEAAASGDLESYVFDSMSTLEQGLTGYQLVSMDEVSINGNPAFEIVYTDDSATQNTDSIKQRSKMLMMMGNDPVTLEFSTSENNFPTFESAIQPIISSVELGLNAGISSPEIGADDSSGGDDDGGGDDGDDGGGDDGDDGGGDDGDDGGGDDGDDGGETSGNAGSASGFA